MTDSTDNKRKRQQTSGNTDDFLESLTPAQIGSALGYWFEHAAKLLAANAEQIKALVESQARTDARIKALAELLIDCIGQSQAGPASATGEEDARRGRLMNSLGITGIGSDAELPDRPRVNDVAEWLRVNPHTIYRLIHSEGIPYTRIGKRTYRFEKAALLEWAESSSSVPELATRRGTR